MVVGQAIVDEGLQLLKRYGRSGIAQAVVVMAAAVGNLPQRREQLLEGDAAAVVLELAQEAIASLFQILGAGLEPQTGSCS